MLIISHSTLLKIVQNEELTPFKNKQCHKNSETMTDCRYVCRHILPGRTQSPRLGNDPRSPCGFHRGGGRQSGRHTRIRSKPLTTLCPFGRRSALSESVSLRAVRLQLSSSGESTFSRRILCVTSPLQMQMQNSWFNILDLAIPAILEEKHICSDGSTVHVWADSSYLVFCFSSVLFSGV